MGRLPQFMNLSIRECIRSRTRPFSAKKSSVIIQQVIFLPRVAPLAQLDRASGYEPEGREFESLRAHHQTLTE